MVVKLLNWNFQSPRMGFELKYKILIALEFSTKNNPWVITNKPIRDAKLEIFNKCTMKFFFFQNTIQPIPNYNVNVDSKYVFQLGTKLRKKKVFPTHLIVHWHASQGTRHSRRTSHVTPESHWQFKKCHDQPHLQPYPQPCANPRFCVQMMKMPFEPTQDPKWSNLIQTTPKLWHTHCCYQNRTNISNCQKRLFASHRSHMATWCSKNMPQAHNLWFRIRLHQRTLNSTDIY